MNQGMAERKGYIDAVKGLLMLFVIWSHSRAWVDIGYFLTAGYMGSFFFLTGYTTVHWDRKFSEYAFGKIRRLLIPYIIYGTFLIIYYIVNNIIRGSISLESFLLCIGGFGYNAYKFIKTSDIILMVCDNNTFWFITTMLISSIISYIVLRAIRNNDKKIRVVVIILLLLATVFFDYVLRGLLLPWGVDTAFIGSILILIGAVYRKNGDSTLFQRLKGNKYAILIMYIGMLSLYLFLVHINPGINMAVKEFGEYGIVSLILFVVVSSLEAILLLIIFRRISITRNRVTPILEWIGKHGITYMTIQIFTIRRINAIAFRFTDNQYLVGYISVVGTLFMGFILSKIYAKFSDKCWILDYL